MRLSNDYWNEPKSQRGLTEKSDMSGYWNTIDLKETKEIIRNERDCLKSRAEADAALEASGRFKRQNETRVTGASPSVSMPHQPASSPWSQNVVPGDPATDQIGYEINEVEAILPASFAVTSGEHSPDAGQGGGDFAAPSAAPSQPHSRNTFRRRF
jgi:hypothetical protein